MIRPPPPGLPSLFPGAEGTAMQVGASPSTLHRPVDSGWPALQKSLPLYELQIAPADLQALEQNLGDRDFEVPGTFRFDARSWSVRVRYRGQHTRYLPKKSFEVKFEDGNKFLGNQAQLQLLAEYKDGGLLTEKLWWDLAAAERLRVPKSQYVRLNLNGSFYGLMTEIESVKKQFLRDHGYDGDSDIYRSGQFDGELRDPPAESYQLPWAKQTNESQPWDNLWEFLAQLNRSAPDGFRAHVAKRFEYEEYLTWLAVDAAISNNTVEDARNYLIWDPVAERWAFVPWDLNNASSLMNRLNGWPQWPDTDRPLKDFSVYDPSAYEIADVRASDPWFTGVKPAWSTLNTRLLDDDYFRARLIGKLNTLLQTHFRVEEIGPRLEAMHALLTPYLSEDPFIDQTLAANSVQYLEDYVTGRRAFIASHLAELQTHGQTQLRIDEVGRDGQGRLFIELWNSGSTNVNLNDMWLTAWLRVPRQAELGSIVVPPNGTAQLYEDELSGLAEVPGEPQFGLFESDGRVPVDTIFLPPLSPGEAWMRSPRASETWKKLTP